MKTKWGVLGSGGIARRRTIPGGIIKADNAELLAVYDSDNQVNQETAEEFNVKACANEDELYHSDCDIVYIATPVDLHYKQALIAAESGKHVFCEKPLGLGVEETQQIIEACNSNKVKLGIGLMMRFHACHQEALRLIKEGRIGVPVFGRAQLSCWYPPMDGAWRQIPERSGGGSLMDMGGHCIDLLEMFCGKTKKVCCFTGNLVQDYPSEDISVVLLEFENGCKGVVDNMFNIPDESSKNRLELYGPLGSMLTEGTIGQGEAGEILATFKESETGYDAQQTRESTDGFKISPPPVNMYRAEVEAFSQAVIDDRDPPVGAELGLWSQKVLAAAYESARKGQVITIE